MAHNFWFHAQPHTHLPSHDRLKACNALVAVRHISKDPHLKPPAAPPLRDELTVTNAGGRRAVGGNQGVGVNDQHDDAAEKHLLVLEDRPCNIWATNSASKTPPDMARGTKLRNCTTLAKRVLSTRAKCTSWKYTRWVWAPCVRLSHAQHCDPWFHRLVTLFKASYSLDRLCTFMYIWGTF